MSPVSPAHIVHVSAVEATSYAYPGEPEGGRGAYRDPSRFLGAKGFGISLHVLYPGDENARYHAEHAEEEFFFVRTGTCKVRLDGKIYQLHPGDILYTPVGVAHSFYNDGTEPCSIWAAGQELGTGADYVAPPAGPVEAGRPPRCINIGDLTPVPVQYEGEPVGLRGESLEVSAALGMERLFCNIHRLLPGQQDSRLHHHQEEEEFFIVLQGTPVLRLGDESQVLQPGDCAYVPAGTPHQFTNRSEAPAIVFMMNTVCGRPDSHYLEG